MEPGNEQPIDYEYIIYEPEVEDGIARITFNRPEVLNAFHLPMVEEIHSALNQAEDDERVVVVLVRGAGRAFCVGRDFKYSGDLLVDNGWNSWRRRLQQPSARLWRLRKVTISQVQGYALGGGNSMAIESDVTIAARDAHFGYPNIRFGSSQLQPHPFNWLIGPKMTKELFFTGRLLDAEEAYNLNLVNHVVDIEELDDKAFVLARDIVTNERRHPGQMAAIKFQINRMHPEMLMETDSYVHQGHQDEREYIPRMMEVEGQYFTAASEKGARAMIEKMQSGH